MKGYRDNKIGAMISTTLDYCFFMDGHVACGDSGVAFLPPK